MKRISIIIPVYNAEKHIRECLESVYRQHLDENTFEVIVVDDGSKDQSMTIVTAVAASHPNLKIISQPNQGVSTARNNGLQTARGNYVWFVDADDMLADNCLATALDVAEKNALDMLKIAFINIKHSPDGILSLPFSSSTHTCVCKSGQEGLIEDFNPTQGYIWQYIFRRKELIDNQLQFHRHLVFCEDWLFSISALLAVKRFMSLPIQAYFYRQHEASAVHNLKKNSILSLNIVIEQTCLLPTKIRLSANATKELTSCIFYLATLDFWVLAHTPTLYIHHKELIADLKNRVPHLTPGSSRREWRFSIFYNYCPLFYIWLRYHLQLKKLTKAFIRS